MRMALALQDLLPDFREVRWQSLAWHFGRANVVKTYQKLYASGLSLSLSSEDNSGISFLLFFFPHVFATDLQIKIFWRKRSFYLVT